MVKSLYTYPIDWDGPQLLQVQSTVVLLCEHVFDHMDVNNTYKSNGYIEFYYAPAYSKNSGRALSVTPVRPVRPSVRPSVRLSVRPYVPLSCPGHNSKTLWNIFMKLHRCIHHNKTMCHEQGRQLSHFWFLNYFPLT